MIEVVCRNGHPATRMRQVMERDAWRCPECHNENTLRFLYSRWGNLLRLARRD